MEYQDSLLLTLSRTHFPSLSSIRSGRMNLFSLYQAGSPPLSPLSHPPLLPAGSEQKTPRKPWETGEAMLLSILWWISLSRAHLVTPVRPGGRPMKPPPASLPNPLTLPVCEPPEDAGWSRGQEHSHGVGFFFGLLCELVVRQVNQVCLARTSTYGHPRCVARGKALAALSVSAAMAMMIFFSFSCPRLILVRHDIYYLSSDGIGYGASISRIFSISEKYLIYAPVSLDTVLTQLFWINVFFILYYSSRTNMSYVQVNMAARRHRTNTIGEQLVEQRMPFVLANKHRLNTVAEHLKGEWNFGLQYNPQYDEEEILWFCYECKQGPYPLWQDHCPSCQHKRCSCCRLERQPKPQ